MEPEVDLKDCKCLRLGATAAATKAYVEYLSQFMQCFLQREEWQNKSKRSKLSQFVPKNLEAFAVLTYINGHGRWKEELGGAPAEASDISSGSSNNEFHYTSARGGGWSCDGLDMYNALVRVLSVQRATQEGGGQFDEALMQVCRDSSLTRRAEVPVDNGLAELAASVGVDEEETPSN